MVTHTVHGITQICRPRGPRDLLDTDAHSKQAPERWCWLRFGGLSPFVQLFCSNFMPGSGGVHDHPVHPTPPCTRYRSRPLRTRSFFYCFKWHGEPRWPPARATGPLNKKAPKPLPLPNRTVPSAQSSSVTLQSACQLHSLRSTDFIIQTRPLSLTSTRT